MTSTESKPQQNVRLKSGIEQSLDLAATLDVSGRRGVRVYSLSRQNLFLFALAVVFIGMPFTILLGGFPFWERVSDLNIVKLMNSYAAPIVNASHEEWQQAWDRRFPIASESIVSFLVLSNFALLLSRKIRKHVLMVWICYDRARLLTYFLLSCILFCTLWYLFFYDLTVVNLLDRHYGTRKLESWMVMSFPILALIFGHMFSIVLIGVMRDISKLILRVQRASGIAVTSGQGKTIVS